jgi:transposase-like protein
MGRKRYTEDFKDEAARQVTEAGHGVYDLTSWLGVSKKKVLPIFVNSATRSFSRLAT